MHKNSVRLYILFLPALLSFPAAGIETIDAENGLSTATLWLGGDSKPENGKPPSHDALVNAAREALAKHAAKLGVNPKDIPEPVTVHAGKFGPNVVTFRQVLDGITVNGARISVALGDTPTARAITGSFSPHTDTLESTAFKLDAATAINVALDELGAGTENAQVKRLDDRNGYQVFAVESKSFSVPKPARVKPVWFATGRRLIAAWYVELAGHRSKALQPESCGCLVSAEDGSILAHRSLIREATHSYRVFTDATGEPLVDAFGNTFPHPTATPDGWRPYAPAPMQLIARDHAGISTGDPWLPAGATETLGNNADAFFNSANDDGGTWGWEGWGPAFNAAEGDFRAPLTSAATFDYAYDANATAGDYHQPPGSPVTPVPAGSIQLNAKIVQAFYATNWLHDLFYDLGFDEAAGNFQHDNFGRGGLDGDRVLVHAGYHGTFAFSPEDGEAPSITLGRNSTSDSGRDVSGFDFPVLVHEWTHLMFERLTVNLTNQGQQGAMNEGMADFVGFLLTVREAHRDAPPASATYSGAYGVGAYYNLDYDFPYDPLPAAGSAGVPDNSYYHGIRRYPYSADFAINPLTLKHLSQDNPLPAGSAPFDWKLRSILNPEVHSAGEVWASALWQCARNLLADETRFPFETRKQRMLAYLVAGMKLFPADADYIEARNAILFAIRAADVTDYELCRQGFALRGFGAGAIAPDRHDVTLKNVTESFSINDAALNFVSWQLQETGGGDGDGVLDVGETGQLTVTLKNTGFVPLPDVTLYVPPLTWAYAFPSGSTATGISLQPNEEVTRTFDVEIVTADGAPMLLFNLSATDATRPDIYGQQDALFTVNYDLRRDSTTDWLISTQAFEADWTVGAEVGHNCVFYCAGDLRNWQRVSHLGDFAYRADSTRLNMDATLATVPFTRYPAAPFRIIVTHDYELMRTGIWGPSTPQGTVEISVDGGAWQDLWPFVESGNVFYSGSSGGWVTETIDLGTRFGGQTVQLRWRLMADPSFNPAPIHWAISRVSIQGAATPVFSNMHIDIH